MAAAVTMSSFAIVTSGYVDPYVALAVAVLALAQLRGSRVAMAGSIAFLVAGKQYVALVIPFLVPVGRRAGWRVVVIGVLMGGLVDLAFWASAPGPFWHDVVHTQLVQPLRPDSISLLVSLDSAVGPLPDIAFSVGPFAAGLLVSGFISLRGRPGATTSAAAIGLGLLAAVLLSKQAFANYFLFIEVALITRRVTWPADGPYASTPVPSRREPSEEKP